jgi:predicted hydrocarbon binding protein
MRPSNNPRAAGLEKEIGERFGAVMGEIGEEGRVKIVNALQRFSELAKENTELAEIWARGQIAFGRRERDA